MTPNFSETIHVWQSFFATHAWQTLIKDVAAIHGGCGIIYELPNYLKRPNESLAIVDMRTVKRFEPHYHTHETEIYFGLQGRATVVVGGKKLALVSGGVIVTPPNTAHFVMPDAECVIAVVNTPPFSFTNYHVLSATNHDVAFDYEQFCHMHEQ
jgi:mannose-6-phosphate isomerase-like protein (cupin superfamily)